MKKTYQKPVVMFESFQMTSNIAGTCVRYEGNQADGKSCGIYDNGWTIFLTGVDNGVCALGPDPEKFCYHAPTDDTSVFAS